MACAHRLRADRRNYAQVITIGISAALTQTLAFTLLKSLYLVITGLFRADDGRPLLAPIADPVVAIALAGWASSHSGSHTLPALVWVLSLWLGPLTALLLSAWAVLRMRRKYPDFRSAMDH